MKEEDDLIKIATWFINIVVEIDDTEGMPFDG